MWHESTTSCECHDCMRVGILPGRSHLDRRMIRVLYQRLWLKSPTARQRYWTGNASTLPFLRNTLPHMFQPPTWRAKRLCSSDLYPLTNLCKRRQLSGNSDAFWIRHWQPVFWQYWVMIDFWVQTFDQSDPGLMPDRRTSRIFGQSCVV
ncbi:hypothetical protein CSKR_107915 [Clonorchis sinensis]|uniref:Uncharacterized protein n=1 Tax=Clonorchis sinensis TaxID=79923 RepID=A0A419PN42_CLOSI|nr:hypothetical protein CSKR_107915 [Clonorchis sinensis]